MLERLSTVGTLEAFDKTGLVVNLLTALADLEGQVRLQRLFAQTDLRKVFRRHFPGSYVVRLTDEEACLFSVVLQRDAGVGF